MTKLIEQLNNVNKKTESLASFIDLIGGGTPKTTVKEYWNGDIPWLSVVDFNNDSRWVSDTEKKITEEGVQNSSTRILNKDDIIISARGTVGVLAQLSRPMAFNQSCYGIRAKDNVDQSYLFYLLKSSIPKLTQIVHGAVFDTITKDSFEQVNVCVPDLPTQKKIAEILSAYDAKIENNNAIIKNLETIAQTIFDEWFISFRFPGYEKVKFVDSEMGEIPEGWEVGKIEDLIKIESGFAFKSLNFSDDGKHKLVTIRNVQDGEFVSDCENKISELPPKLPDHCKLSTGDILLSLTGNVGRVCLVIGEDYVLNQRVSVLVPKDLKDDSFTYFLFRRNSFQNILINLAKGSAQPNLSPVDTKKLEIVIPSRVVLDKFSFISNSLFKQIIELKNQNFSLKSQRDQLLAKLI
ncbi:MAG: hypothetical protein HGA67_03785 [Candidatus Yonathbacteria bacterium]|nr:hypothetical protein [Candidatus Yonathbacteria bacterium]